MIIVKNIVRVLTAALSVVMIWWYYISNMMNIGTVAGILFFLAAGLSALFFDNILGFIKKLRQNKVWKFITNAAAVIIAILMVFVITILCMMKYYSARKPAETATVVVLGCQVNGETPSLMLRKRLEAAYSYLSDHENAGCIVSGGKGNHEDISEAECMYRWLTEKGISPSRIYKEDKSTNTDENISFSGEIIKSEGLSKELAIVTDGFHEMRAAMIAGRLGYNTGAVPAQTPMYLSASFTTRELIALAAEIILP